MKMNLNGVALVTFFGLAIVLSSRTASAAIVLAVDFDSNSGDTQAGFIGVAGSINLTQTVGGFEVTAPSTGHVDRPSMTASSVSALYRDWINLGSESTFTLTIKNVTANTLYDLTLFAYDDALGGNYVELFAPSGATTGESGAVNWTGSVKPITLLQYADTIRISSTTDTLSVDVTAPAGSFSRLNGFILETVPEPSAGILTMIASWD